MVPPEAWRQHQDQVRGVVQRHPTPPGQVVKQ
jgi:hypothetical protein